MPAKAAECPRPFRSFCASRTNANQGRIQVAPLRLAAVRRPIDDLRTAVRELRDRDAVGRLLRQRGAEAQLGPERVVETRRSERLETRRRRLLPPPRL
jgi:hypothetical protein